MAYNIEKAFQSLNVSSVAAPVGAYENKTGLDALRVSTALQKQMESVNTQIQKTYEDSNLAETEKMFTLQLLVNNYTTIGQTRTSLVKAHADLVKSAARNIS